MGLVDISPRQGTARPTNRRVPFPDGCQFSGVHPSTAGCGPVNLGRQPKYFKNPNKSALDGQNRRRTVNGLRQTVKGSRQTSNGSAGTSNDPRQTVKGRRRTSKGLRQTVKGSPQTSNGSRQTVKGSRQTSNGLRQTVKGWSRTFNGSSATYRQSIQFLSLACQNFKHAIRRRDIR